MKNTIESKFEHAKQRLTLSETEKAFHREELVAFMLDAKKPVLSPYTRSVFPMMRYAFAALLMVAAGGTGIAFAAEQSLPGDALYSVKLQVTESIQVRLAATPDDRAAVETEFVSRRLDELAQITDDDTEVHPAVLAMAKESLETHIDAVQSRIDELQASGDAGAALQANSDLSAVLDAGSDILNSVSDANPDSTSGIEEILSGVEDAHEETEIDGSQIEASIATSIDAEDIRTSLSETSNDARDALAILKAELANPGPTLDLKDQGTIAEGIAAAEDLINQASVREETDPKSALLLYSEANQGLSTLQSIVEADGSLAVDVVGDDEVPASGN